MLQTIGNDFDVFVTVNQNLQYQQNLKKSKLAILVLVAPSNRYDDLKAVIPSCLSALEEIKPGQVKKYYNIAVHYNREFLVHP